MSQTHAQIMKNFEYEYYYWAKIKLPKPVKIQTHKITGSTQLY